MSHKVKVSATPSTERGAGVRRRVALQKPGRTKPRSASQAVELDECAIFSDRLFSCDEHFPAVSPRQGSKKVIFRR
jgi:hypothetical protein